MERQALKAEVRALTGKGHNKRLRREGKVPGIVYGKKGEVFSIHVDRSALNQAMNTAAGYNILLDLDIQGEKKETVMIKEVKKDVIRKELLTHIDFIRVSLKDKLEVNVPVVIVGEPEGIKEGGIPQIQLREITLLSLPTEIPESISVDVSALGVGDSLAVKDIEFSAGIDVLNEPEELIFSVLAPRMEEEPEGDGEETGEEGETGEGPAAEEGEE
jgi:large subunit ribosomal protein L25